MTVRYSELHDAIWLRTHYWGWGKSTWQIASELGCAQTSVRRAMVREGIGRGRPGRRTIQGNISLSPYALAFLDGELLGDGCVFRQGEYYPDFRYASAYREYLAWLARHLVAFGVRQSGKLRSGCGTTGRCWGYQSKRHAGLLPVYERWYPNGNKAVPKDLVLRPVTVRQWYIGDGHLDRYGSIELCTDTFAEGDVARLADGLAGLGLDVRRIRLNRIRVCKASVPGFLDYIGPCPIACYAYKWEGY